MNRSHRLTLGLVPVGLVSMALLFSASAWADDNPIEGCENAIEAWEDEDTTLALEEARWCVEGLEQVKQAAVAGQFKEEVMGMTGGAVGNNRAMGMVVIDRTYSGDGGSIDVTLTRSGGANDGMAGLGALASMGMMGAGRKVRINGHTGTFLDNGENVQLMVTPREGGGLLNFDSRSLSQDEVEAFAEEFLEDFEF